MTNKKQDKLLEECIIEVESFLKECKSYQKRINNYHEYNWNNGKQIVYDSASFERGVLKARSLLIIRKLQAWRKNGAVS